MSLEQNAEKLSESVDITESRYGIGSGVQEKANLSNPSKYVLKGKRKINEFKYCLAFDLAHRLSGYALVDVKNREVYIKIMISEVASQSTLLKNKYHEKSVYR